MIYPNYLKITILPIYWFAIVTHYWEKQDDSVSLMEDVDNFLLLVNESYLLTFISYYISITIWFLPLKIIKFLIKWII